MAQSGKESAPSNNTCPLSLHRSGHWYKKIRGKFHYFGKDKEAAVKAYEAMMVSAATVGDQQTAPEQDAPAVTGNPPAQKAKRSQCPLRRHKSGQWYKYIRGKFHYFGKDRDEAIKAYEAQATYLHTGQGIPLTTKDDLTLLSLCNQYLEHQEARIKTHEIGPKHYYDQRSRLKTFAKFLGPRRPARDITALDLQNYRTKLIKDGHKPNGINNHLAVVKALFHWAEDSEILGTIPKLRAVKKINVKKAERKDRREKKYVFSPEQIRKLMERATVNMRAMILLGINCAFGCTDVAELRWSDLDLEKGIVDLPRGKTGVERNPDLWPETVASLKAVRRRKGPLVFYTKHGNPYVRINPKTMRQINHVSKGFCELIEKAGLQVPEGTGFYTLRRTAATIAAKTGNPFAVQGLLGHTTVQMASTYIQEVRKQTVEAVNHINGWFNQ